MIETAGKKQTIKIKDVKSISFLLEWYGKFAINLLHKLGELISVEYCIISGRFLKPQIL